MTHEPLHESAIPPGGWTLARLQDHYPWVEWAEPQKMVLAGDPVTYYACRVCIANKGIKAGDIPFLTQRPEFTWDDCAHVQVHGDEPLT